MSASAGNVGNNRSTPNHPAANQPAQAGQSSQEGVGQPGAGQQAAQGAPASQAPQARGGAEQPPVAPQQLSSTQQAEQSKLQGGQQSGIGAGPGRGGLSEAMRNELGLNADGSFRDVGEVKGAQGTAGVGKTAEAQEGKGTGGLYGTGDNRVPPPQVPRTGPLTPEQQASTETMLRESQELFAKAMMNDDGTVKNLEKFGRGDLALEALKLRIMNALNDPETMNRLIDANDELGDVALKAFETQSDRAEEAKKEAEQYAKTAKILSAIVTVVLIIVALVVAAFTGGAGAVLIVGVLALAGAMAGAIAGAASGKSAVDSMLLGASVGAAVGSLGAGFVATGGSVAAQAAAQTAAKTAQEVATQTAEVAVKEAAKEAAKQAAQQAAAAVAKKTAAQTIGVAVTAVGEGGKAGADYKATRMALEAQELDLSAEGMRRLMELLQSSTEDATAFLQMIMEMISSSFDNALSSIEAKGNVTNQLIASSGPQ